MTKTDKKIISIFLLLIMIIAQLSPVFAADYAGQETTKTLTQYLIENGVDGNGDGVLSDAEWAKVKNLDLMNVDLTGIEKAVNLKKLWLKKGCNLDVADFSKLTKLEELFLNSITLSDNAQANIGKATNLKSLSLNCCVNYSKINFANLQKLYDLYIYDCYDVNTTFKLPVMASLKDLYFIAYANESVDFSELADIEYLRVGLGEGTAKFPKFNNLMNIDVFSTDYRIGKVAVDGMLDLSNCDYIYGDLSIDSSKLVLNEKILYTKYIDEIYLSPIEEEISLRKDEIYYLGTGTQLFELVSNDDDTVAFLMEECLDETENILSSKIVAKNVGTTNMKIKDALGNEVTIKINVSNKTVTGNVDTSLENTGVTAEFVADCEKILKSNGELWEVNSSTTAEKVETNVKDYVAGWVYTIGSSDTTYVINLLKNDGKLRIEYEDTVKEVSNVKQIEDNLYLTNDGKLYESGLNYITEEINPKLIKENVKKLINECIVLEDGTTWYQNYDRYHLTYNVEFKKLADFEIKDMYYYKDVINEYSYQVISTVVDMNDNLWCCADKSYYFNDAGLEKIQENFAGYELQPHGGFYDIDGFEISENGDAVWRKDGTVILSNVSQVYYNNAGDGHVIIRTDGTIWTYNDIYGLTKITTSTSFDDEEEKEEFLTPTTQVNSKELGTSTMISGISNNTNVQNFMKQNNFNNAYQAKIFDKNNNEITGESLLGTGSTVKLYEDGKVVKEYVIVIYGDTTGDGKITAVDALAVIKHINNKILFTKDAYSEAGRVRANSGTTLTSVDALAIIKGVNGKFTINQDK